MKVSTSWIASYCWPSEKDTIEDVLEPYLIQQGYLQRTPRGRIATQRAYAHFGLERPADQ